MSNDPKSPVTGSANVSLVKSVDTTHLIEIYRRVYKTDVSKNFSGLAEVQVWRCDDTGYEFFTPFTTAGDAQFYEELYGHDVDAFYMDNKWEHLIAKDWVKKNQLVLDIGCGGGAFLAMLRDKTSELYGLEQSRVGQQEAAAKGVTVSGDDVISFSKTASNKYDMVSSFQVLEHVADVKPFLEAKIAMVKPGGLMVISVPNNDAFIRLDPNFVLNAPPHHVGLWRRSSLEAIGKLYGLEIIHIEREPLQEKNIGWFTALMEQRHIKGGLARKVYYKMGFSRMLQNSIRETSSTIDGHTIMMCYRKPA